MQLFIKIYYDSVQKYDNKSYGVRKIGKIDQKVKIAAIQSVTIPNHRGYLLKQTFLIKVARPSQTYQVCIAVGAL